MQCSVPVYVMFRGLFFEAGEWMGIGNNWQSLLPCPSIFRAVLLPEFSIPPPSSCPTHSARLPNYPQKLYPMKVRSHNRAHSGLQTLRLDQNLTKTSRTCTSAKCYVKCLHVPCSQGYGLQIVRQHKSSNIIGLRKGCVFFLGSRDPLEKEGCQEYLLISSCS